MPVALAELVELQARHRGKHRLDENLGDGFLYEHNRVFRNLREAALARGVRFSTTDPGSYFGFPLTQLGTILQTRTIPYRNNFQAIVDLENARPGFFHLGDLDLNRPTPNYLLHESAHVVAFHELFGKPERVKDVLGDPDQLVPVMLGEAFAMAVEYLAACCVSGAVHDWLFSVNSYRHRVQSKKAIGELIDAHGYRPIAWTVLAAFLYNNFFVDRLRRPQLERILAFTPMTAGLRLDASERKRLQSALSGLMMMNPDFRQDTSRLFLSAYGYSREVREVLRRDPLERAGDPTALARASERLVAVIDGSD